MMNPPSTTHTVAPPGISSQENRGYADPSHGQPVSYHSPATGPDSSWTTHGADSYSMQNPVPSSSPYNFEQPSQAPAGEGLNGPTAGSTSSLGSTAVPQEYNGYTTYQTPADSSYGYGTTGYTSYYSGYQQQTNQSYSQPTGTYPNTGVYQPLSSFQNTGSYAVPASYSSTYYNPGDYQTSGGYPTPTSSYSNQNQNQTTQWNSDNYANYTTYQYPNYPQATTRSYASSSAPPAPVHYQQQYSQSYSQPDVTCAPGTENLSVTAKNSLEGPVPGVTVGYSTPTIQPPQASVPSWRPEAIQSQQPSVQSSTMASAAHDGYWNQNAPSFTNQNHHSGPRQPELYQPFDSKPTYSSLQDQQNTSFAQPQGPSVQYPVAHQVPRSHQPIVHQVPQSHQPVAHQVPQSHQSIAHQVPQSHQSIAHQAPQTHQSIQQTSSVETRRVTSFQIQSNPRIATNMGLGSAKSDKVSSYPSAAAKPAYISVALPKPSDQASTDATDSTLKSGLFPKSLKGYVERALARCKDESQLVACQAVMKEIITRATSDGTLHTRDWDIEPLFPLPDAGRINTELQFSSPGSTFKKSPSKRGKSRWEPLPEDKPLEKTPLVSSNNMRYSGWQHMKERDRKVQPFSINNSQSKDDGTSTSKFSAQEQNNVRSPKRQRLIDKADNGGDGSSDSEKEQNYYTGGISVVNTPEERKRRESRSKRFEKVHGNRTEGNHYKPKGAGAASLYSRRATAMVISKNFEPGGSDEAVEDIDWDSLTVKGTCQEIEKRYLRLTSAPDPSTVRPEDVLEKALLMVQSSPKNYLYKCDQLKSIRQDLTVQRIRNHLTVKVYETHARLALEAGDLPEFNQCQSQLKTLYAEGIDGCRMEFSAYGLLCVIMHSNNNRDLVSLMSRLSVDSKEDEAVKHALAVRAAVTSGNYVMFFRLYKTAPNLNACLMDLYVDKMRYKAVTCMSKTYRPTIPVSYIAQVLGFGNANEIGDEKQQDGLEECMEWLKAHGACLITDNNGEMQLDTKASSSSLYIPEPDDAVAHGDANLAVNDFFARALS